MTGDHGVRVFIMYQSTIFALGVKEFLAGAPGIEIAGMEPESVTALEIARSLRPDVAIIEHTPGEASYLQALLDIPTVRRAASLSLTNDVAEVYEVQRIQVGEPSALIAAICPAVFGKNLNPTKSWKEVRSTQVPI